MQSHQHEGLTIIKPSDPAFERAVNYWYYCLMYTSMVCLAEEKENIRASKKVLINV